MKVVVLGLLLAVSSAFAGEDCQPQNGQFTLSQDESISVDVLNKPVVTFVVELPASKETPSASVIAEHAGFECDVFSLEKRKTRYGAETHCWEVKVTWAPGADSSGCEVTVNHGSLPTDALKAFLYMNF